MSLSALLEPERNSAISSSDQPSVANNSVRYSRKEEDFVSVHIFMADRRCSIEIVKRPSLRCVQ